VRKTKLWKRVLGVEHLVFEDGLIESVPGGGAVLVLVLRVRPDHGHRNRCSRCGHRAVWRDDGEGCQRWRALDAGLMACCLEAGAPRVACPVHGVVMAALPWARPGSRFTAAFEDQAAWMWAQMPWSRIAVLLRTTWRVAAGDRGAGQTHISQFGIRERRTPPGPEPALIGGFSRAVSPSPTRQGGRRGR
jgi:transposase